VSKRKRACQQRPRLLVEILEDRIHPSVAPAITLQGPTLADVVKTSPLSILFSAAEQNQNVKATLTFSLVGAPVGANISSQQNPSLTGPSATGTLTWTPTEDQGPASYTFTVMVTDSRSTPLSASQMITVNTLADGLVGNDLWIVGTSTNQGTTTNPGNDSASVSATNSASTVSVTINGATAAFTVPTGGKSSPSCLAVMTASRSMRARARSRSGRHFPLMAGQGTTP